MSQYHYENTFDLVDPLKMSQDLQGFMDYILRTTAI